MIIKGNRIIKSSATNKDYRVIDYEVIPTPDILAYAMHRCAEEEIADDEAFVFSYTGGYLGVSKLVELPFKLVESFNCKTFDFDAITAITFDENFPNRLVATMYVAADISKLEE